ncbi:hypothetical protein ACU6RU_15210 [Microbacterium sp. F1-18]
MRVLFDTRSKHFFQNPYIGDLAEAIPEAEIHGFTWRKLLFGRFDIFHVHWPEWLIRHRRVPQQALMRVLLRLALIRLKRGRMVVVRTMHNRAPHQALDPVGTRLVAAIEATAASRIWLDPPARPSSRGEIDVVIPHPDYQQWRSRLAVDDAPPPGERKSLCIGSLVPYRKFELVVEAVTACAEGSLVVAGAATDRAYAERLARLVGASGGRVSLIAARLEDAEMAALIQASDLVVVPYEGLLNSGIVFLALTLQRPVALPAGVSAERLRAEYGHDWVRIWEGALDAHAIDTLHEPGQPAGRCYSTRREIAAVGAAHRKHYELVSTLRR